MALSEDGSTLYAALSGADAVSALDTSTLTEMARYATGTHTCPGNVQAAGERVWFTYGCDDSGVGGLGAVDLSGDTPTVQTDLVGAVPTHPLLSVAGSTLALGLPQSPASVRTYDISTGTPVEQATADVGEDLRDLQVTPDGTRVLVASNSPHHHHERLADDLSVVETYDTGGFAQAVDTTRDGDLVALGSSSAGDGIDVRVVDRGSGNVVRALDFGKPDATAPSFGVAARALAFSADGSRLYAVTHDDTGDGLTLRVLQDPGVYRSGLTADAVRTDGGEALRVSGTLTVEGDPSAQPATLGVTRQDSHGTTALDEVPTDSAGAFSFEDDSATPGQVTYTVRYAGDATHEAATTEATTLAGPAGPWDTDADDDAELVVGSFKENIGSTKDAGMFAVLHGSPSGVSGAGAQGFTQKTSGMPGAVEAYDQLGFSSTSGDFDGDGFADVVVSANAEAIGSAQDVGMVTVLPGTTDGPSAEDSLPISPRHVNRVRPGSYFGEGLATGDFDADGYDDLAVGAPGADWVAVFPGGPDGLDRSAGTVWSQETAGVPGMAADEPYADEFGLALDTGDANGDGFADLAVGAPWDYEDRGYSSGSVTMLYGSGAGLTSDGAQRWSRDSPGIKNRPRDWNGEKGDGSDDLGLQVTLADHDGDGYDDLAAAAPGSPRWEDGKRRADAGSVSLLYGSADGITAHDQMLAQDKPGIPGKIGPNDQFGMTLATGDTDGDGKAELAVAALGEHTVTMLAGSSDALGPAGADRYSQSTPGVTGKDEKEDAFGSALRMASFDGDAYDDLAIGVPGENTHRGAVAVLYAHDGSGLSTSGSTWLSQHSPGVPGSAEAWDWFGSFF